MNTSDQVEKGSGEKRKYNEENYKKEKSSKVWDFRILNMKKVEENEHENRGKRNTYVE